MHSILADHLVNVSTCAFFYCTLNFYPRYEETSCWDFILANDPFRLKNRETDPPKNYFVANFDQERLTEFVNFDDEDRFFSPAVRGRLVAHLLEKGRFGNEPTDIGKRPLIATPVP